MDEILNLIESVSGGGGGGFLPTLSNNTVVVFTEGLCRENPGPCGAGFCIILPHSDKVELKQTVSKLASILLGALVAIKITLDFTP